MGTPSGSKNATVFEDRMVMVGMRDFESGAVDDCCEDAMNKAGCKQGGSGGLTWNQEKHQKVSEENEFRAARAEVRYEKRASFVDKMMPKAQSAGPSDTMKRKLPSFVKLKSKDSVPEEEEAGPEQKLSRRDSAASGAGALAEEGGAAARPSSDAASPAPEASPGGGLVAYGSDDSDEGSE
mmetsp:Transcript_53687/g.136210  ORF Transcript_53687/g.136210 Transcript_53687/m.136210 type:complete len:181 (-) Transcript_53687:81-623(-)